MMYHMQTNLNTGGIMRPNKVKQMWANNEPVLAGWLSSGDPYCAEAMANAGFDAVIIDMQHGFAVTPDRAVACLQAISTTDATPVVRMSWNEPKDIQFVLDAGAYGVIVPLVDTKEQAQQAVGAAKYPPVGYRSHGPNRARLYAGMDYTRHANDEIFVLAMIETKTGIDNIEEIATVPGLDGFYIGPADLAMSYGIDPLLGPDNWNKDPVHMAACQKVLDVAQAHNLVPCHHSSNAADAKTKFSQGFMMAQTGGDVNMVLSTSINDVKTAKG